MPLKIFVSSVSSELDVERRALKNGIDKLGEIYVGMECFGSDPRSASVFDAAAVRDSDLYVGLLGDRFGSPEKVSGKSFTELEYETARGRGIPTLVYFNRAFLTGSEDPRQATFKQRVRQDQLGAVFQDAHELENQFLIDLFKQIRGPLFAKLRPQLGSIPFDALHAVTKGLLPEQVKTVGQDKYIPNIYVPRPAEESVQTFVDFEEHFVSRAQELLDHIELIAARYGLSEAKPVLLNARAATLRSHNTRGLEEAAVALKRACHFDGVEADFANLERVYHQPDRASRQRASTAFVASIQDRAYVDQAKLTNLAEIVLLIAGERALGAEGEDQAVRSVFPSILIERRVVLANDLLKELDLLIEKSSKRCIALVDRAGRGKTNVICRIAESALEKHAVILLSGQIEISSEYHIEWHIQRQIEAAFGAAFSDWMPRSEPALEQERRWIFVVVDGINESANLPLFIKLLRNFLPKLISKRIKLILSCRDIFWDLFLPGVRSYLFEEALPLNEFSEQEWRQAISLYFERFRVDAKLNERAALSLRNPLLLRFFCEAYQGRNMGQVSDIHLLSVFKLYIERVGRTIAERTSMLSPAPVMTLLLRVVDSMWQNRRPAIEQSWLDLTPEEMASSESIYNMVRSENVILDESRHLQSTVKIVRFVYDEFMEYMLAQSWLEQILATPNQDSATEALLQQAMEATIAFPSAMGAVLFLDQMLTRSGRLVRQAISMLGPVRDVLLNSRQMTLLYALENVDVANSDDNLMDIVDRFETVAAPDLRARLAQVVLRLLEENPGRAGLRPIVARMLEIVSGKDNSPPASGSTGREPVNSGFGAKLKVWQDASVKAAGSRSQSVEKDTSDVPLLPPARHHYTDETKLNAISLLIASRNPDDYELVEQAIRRMGRMDLHSALFALQSTDTADDDFVYRTIEGQISSALPEYRVYCAWLLRHRYGRRPSEFLLRLLSTEETRVHTYTFSLFDTRQIEKELLDGILIEMRAFERIKPWLLLYRVKLLGRRTSFTPPGLAETLGRSCADALMVVSKHPSASVRMAAYRSLTAFPELVGPAVLMERMRTDPEPRIRLAADRMIG
jgi:Domain of unknown function (DUF4062)